jgi:hypothetical protein
MGKISKNEKKKWGKLKLNSQQLNIEKNKFNKYNFLKKTCGENTVVKQKSCKGNTVVIHSVFFFKKKKLQS